MRIETSPSRAAPFFGFFAGIGQALVAIILSWALFFWFPPFPIIITIGALFLPFLGLAARRGPCPNCGKNLIMMRADEKCPRCKHRINSSGGELADLDSWPGIRT